MRSERIFYLIYAEPFFSQIKFKVRGDPGLRPGQCVGFVVEKVVQGQGFLSVL